ncbi:hypothetical protein [Desulfocurvus sp. DL9XJH121]
MRLTFLFLFLTLLAVYGIDSLTTPPVKAGKLQWSDRVYVRMEGRFCPLFFPAEDLR